MDTGRYVDPGQAATGPPTTILADGYENVFTSMLDRDHSFFPGPREIDPSWIIVVPMITSRERDGRPMASAWRSWDPARVEPLDAAHVAHRSTTPCEQAGTPL